ncbi:MAG TPA: glycosyltransferase family 4 protein [Acidimicrobiales bacterium]
MTNDFPPKIGGIQAYLWELWRRLDPDDFAVLTASSSPDQEAFDREQGARGVRIERVRSAVLAPTPGLVRRIRQSAARVGADLVVIDPAFPLGVIGPRLGIPYAVVLHGAEVAIPARLPLSRELVAYILRNSVLAISAGGYPAAEARRAVHNHGMPPTVEIPPGVDLERFVPLSEAQRTEARSDLGLPVTGPLVVSVSRLVPRKGMDVVVNAALRLQPSFPDLTVAISGRGRDRERLSARIAETGSPARLLGAVSDDDLPRLVGAADVFVMACRNRWLGLEQEGFGIVFVEAAAAGVPQVAGRSGGASEAVVDGETGLVVHRPGDIGEVTEAIRRLLDDKALRHRLSTASRQRAEASFDYDHLAPRLAAALADVEG